MILMSWPRPIKFGFSILNNYLVYTQYFLVMIRSRSQNALQVLLLLISFNSFSQQPGSYKILNDKVIIYPDVKLSGGAKTIQVQVMNDNIIRVTASPGQDIYTPKSLSVILQPQATTSQIKEDKGKVVITTTFKTIIEPLSGNISFADLNGNDLIKEKKITGRKISPVVFEGTPLYNLSQDFELTDDDAVYGLGQHQDDVWNYKGRQVLFFQNNTEIAIPFLVSIKNYGLFWDNYSLTKAGDVRSYQPLTSQIGRAHV